MTQKEKIIFGHKPDWEKDIRACVGADYDIVVGGEGWCARNDWQSFDLIVPLTIRDGWMLRKAGIRLAGKALCPSAQAVAFCHDKHGFSSALSLTRFHATIPRLIDKADGLMFPCILKQKMDEYGTNSLILHGEADAVTWSRRIGSPGYFLQEYISGSEERATHLLLRNGRIVHAYTVAYDMGEQPFVKGQWCQHRSMTGSHDERFLDVFADILRIAGFTDGTCCFDYKVVDGIPKIFEVNPRFGWSLLYDLGNYLRAYGIAARA
ncbi:hypothetical protein [Methylobacterium sp. SyP6R]|uniref:hypothetical protein n=1 Tax=Methylobacterium sp. SyP6R TaxID=2718876 RepID=UPI001F46B13A|nr:hypothetical protein [Methylobacterium sp. SyP6R]MCF4127464.1 hypothetical protein [Methylobacterium sp. SyP6R]